MGASDEKSGFVFERVNTDFLSQNGIMGPVVSAQSGTSDEPFVFVTANGTIDEEGFDTYLKSPFLNGLDHFEECVKFWFDFRVRY